MRLGVYVFFVIVDRFRERCLFHIDLAAFLFALFTNARNRAETSIQCQSLKQQRCDYWQTADQPPPLPSPPPLLASPTGISKHNSIVLIIFIYNNQQL